MAFDIISGQEYKGSLNLMLSSCIGDLWEIYY